MSEVEANLTPLVGLQLDGGEPLVHADVTWPIIGKGKSRKVQVQKEVMIGTGEGAGKVKRRFQELCRTAFRRRYLLTGMSAWLGGSYLSLDPSHPESRRSLAPLIPSAEAIAHTMDFQV